MLYIKLFIEREKNTGQSAPECPFKEQLSSRRASLFGHIARLDTTVPAHLTLWLQTDITIGRKPDASWRRTPGRPRKTWISLQIQEDVHNVSAQLLGRIYPSWPWQNDATVVHES